MDELGKVIVHRQNSQSIGREANVSRTYHGRMDLGQSRLGASTGGSNSKQLFGAGWPARFLSAMKIVGGRRKFMLSANLAIDASGIPTFPFARGKAKRSYLIVRVLDVKERGIIRA
jgi:hypothetical protein